MCMGAHAHTHTHTLCVQFSSTQYLPNPFMPYCHSERVYFRSYWLGYEPMKGDWVQAQYFINQSQWASQAQSVRPLRYQRLNEVLLPIPVTKDIIVPGLVCLDPRRRVPQCSPWLFCSSMF